jgi:hypothetical protein
MNRRKFLINAFSLVAAPAVVQASSLMPIKVVPFDPYMVLRGPSLYTGEMMDIRVYDDGSLIDSFVNPSFLDRYNEAARKFMGYPTVGIAHTAEEAKAMRMVEAPRPKLFTLGRSAPEPYAYEDMRNEVNPSQYANLKHKGLL